MREHIEAFLNSLLVERGYSSNTVVAYRNDLEQFAAFLGGRGDVRSWADVGRSHLQHYMNALRGEREYASATVARKVAATKSFFHYLVSTGVLPADPSDGLDSPKVRKYLPTSISEEEVERLLRAPSRHNTSRALRDGAMLELLYATGMRVSEVVELDLDDVDLEGSLVHCRGRNGRGKERTIPVYRPRAVQALARYLEESRPQLVRDPNERALLLNHRGKRLTRQGLWLIIRKYVQEAGISAPVTPHTLRHSFATHKLNGGADVHEVQGLLGHANVSTTQIYAQISPGRVREMYDEAHPRTR